MSDLHGQIHLVNALGMRVSVDFIGEDDAFSKMHALGRAGWGPLDVPAGGFRLPLALHEKFDWSLIGAFALEIEGEHGVMFQGQFYKRREFEEQVKGKKLPAAIKYSRGAKPTDEPHLIEGDEKSSFKYVTLISFRGNGKSIPRFEVVVGNDPRAQQRQQQEPALRGEALADAQSRGEVPVSDDHPLERQIVAIGKLIEKHGFAQTAVAAVVRDVTRGRTRDINKIKPAEAAEVMKQLANAAARKAS